MNTGAVPCTGFGPADDDCDLCLGSGWIDEPNEDNEVCYCCESLA